MCAAAVTRQQLSYKASNDAAFRQKLLDDQHGTIENEFNVVLPSDFSDSVREESAGHAHLLIPTSSVIFESDLASVSGGRQRHWSQTW